jgi:hypothetical protein
MDDAEADNKLPTAPTSQEPVKVPADPPPKNPDEWQRIEGTEIFKRRSNGTYYERPKIAGTWTFRSLKSKNQKDALAEWARRESKRAQGEDPQPKHPTNVTAGDCIRLYQGANYPDKQMAERPETMRKAEAANCAMLLRYWDEIPVEDILISECDDYKDWRIKEIGLSRKQKAKERARKKAEKEAAKAAELAKLGKKPRKRRSNKARAKSAKTEAIKGTRTVDLDLNTLRNALLWSARKGQIRNMPMAAGWPTYCTDKSVRHCREAMPADANDLHRIARMLFRAPNSEVLGFQMLFEAYTGQRTEEILQLRADARANTPGWVTPDGRSLCVTRVKGQNMVNPFAAVHDGLAALLEVWKVWKAKRYPESPWYLPGRNPEKMVSKCALGHALRRLRKEIGKRIISHGMRAFYVTNRRSHGIPDNQISFEIGHISGGKTLSDVYGGAPPHWQKGDGPKLKWLPDEDPAWTVLNIS